MTGISNEPSFAEYNFSRCQKRSPLFVITLRRFHPYPRLLLHPPAGLPVTSKEPPNEPKPTSTGCDGRESAIVHELCVANEFKLEMSEAAPVSAQAAGEAV